MTYTQTMINRDINPTPEARVAMVLYNRRYAAGRLGSMGFYDSLTNGEKRTCQRIAEEIIDAAKAHSRIPA